MCCMPVMYYQINICIMVCRICIFRYVCKIVDRKCIIRCLHVYTVICWKCIISYVRVQLYAGNILSDKCTHNFFLLKYI